MTHFLWHNGHILPADAPISRAQDRMRLGDGVFDTMLLIDGAPLHHDLHFNRLRHDADILGLPFPLPDLDTHAKVIQQLVTQNNLGRGRVAVNTILSRGTGARGVMPSPDSAPSLYVIMSPVPDAFPDCHALICSVTRRNEHSPLSRIKSFHYGDQILALNEAKANGVNEAILLNTSGHISCTSAGNIYAALDGQLITPPLSDGAMDGITRQLLLQAGIVQEHHIHPDDVPRADAIYFSNSVRGVCRIQSVIGRTPFDPDFTSLLDSNSDLGKILGI